MNFLKPIYQEQPSNYKKKSVWPSEYATVKNKYNKNTTRRTFPYSHQVARFPFWRNPSSLSLSPIA